MMSVHWLGLVFGLCEATTLSFVRPWPGAIIPIRNSHPHAGGDLWTAVQELEALTPLRFVNRTDEEDFIDVVVGHDNVVVNPKWPHDTSDVIGFFEGRSEVQLSSTWLAMHELGHVLGLVHEHQRSDRDKYVEVLWDNIDDPEPGYVNWVRLGDCDTQGLPYDPNSIMHYGSDWQGNGDSVRTIRWLGSSQGAAGDCIHYDCTPVVGWSHLTATDVAAITMLYKEEVAVRNSGASLIV